MRIQKQAETFAYRYADVEAPPPAGVPAVAAAPTMRGPMSPAEKSQLPSWNDTVKTVKDIGGRYRENPVTLGNGTQTHVYLDVKGVLNNGHRMNQAAKAMLEHANALGLDYNTVGGPTMGGDVVSHGMVGQNPDLNWFSVRDKPKTDHGLGKWIEGTELGPGHKVLLTDDVANTGESLVEAYHRILDTGAKVSAVMPMVDRSNKTRALFEKLGVPYHPLMDSDDLGLPPLGSGAPTPPVT